MEIIKLQFCSVNEVQFAPCISYGLQDVYFNEKPVMLQIKNQIGQLETYENAYDSVECIGAEYICKSVIDTASGSRFLFYDVFAIDFIKKEIRFSRKVHIEKTSPKDLGFSTEFGLNKQMEEKTGFCNMFEVFAPGIWYKQNKGVVKSAFASNMHHRNYYFRATRMALPYIQLCDRKTGGYISICHIAPVPDTNVMEISVHPHQPILEGTSSPEWIVDESLQYASLGITTEDETMIKYAFPGSEGEVNYLNRSVTWARRSHPVKKGVRHEYQLGVVVGHADQSSMRMRDVWRHWYQQYQPAIYNCNLQKVYEDGVNLINTYCQEYNSVMGLPFWAAVPQGNVCDISYQMGFVGQQTQCAYYLIRYGFEKKLPEMIEKGRKIIEFWVNRSTENSYFPQVWYDVFPAKFKEDYPSYTRTAADGMEGILNCYQYLKKQGEVHEEWLDFCCIYAKRLGMVQQEDGSVARAYDQKGNVVHPGKYNTTNIIRFLTNLYYETNDGHYKETALRAGKFCYDKIYKEMAYIGGTADNDNTIDKEAGMIALYAFMALYDLDADPKWVEAAKGAADFCETWTYSWTFPVKPNIGNGVFERVDQTGLSLIATGHSHCDVMMGYCPYDFYRLYLLTKDEHYYEFARMILYNTKQTTDWSGIHGHAYPGLVEESGEIALQYHNGLGKWLPWCTIAEIEAITRLYDTYGSMDLLPE